MRSIRRSEGFTLIELMIVVAIIGILAAIAIPNFLKFQCKAKQSEAKTNLAGIFTAEKAFFGEYNTYSTDLVSVNWFPDGAPLYIYGFTTAGGSTTGISGYDSARQDTINGGVIGSARYSTLKMHNLSNTSLANGNLPTGTIAGGSSFTAGAAGDVDTDPSTVTGNSMLDTWSMDSSKALTSVQNDCST